MVSLNVVAAMPMRDLIWLDPFNGYIFQLFNGFCTSL